MKKIKIGINGMGRIGRTVLKELIKRNSAELEIVAVNNPGKLEEYVHLIKYDSIHGTFAGNVRMEEGKLLIDNHRINFYTEKDPSHIPWAENEVQIVIDATGVFKDKTGLSKHLGPTVKKVIMCAPGKELDGTFVMGVNHET